jgi:hypothetical protein
MDRVVGFEPTTSALSKDSFIPYLKGAATMEREELHAQILPNPLRNART